MGILTCPQCSTHLSTPVSVLEGTVQCPVCHILIQVLSRAPASGFQCPFCRTTAPPKVWSKVAVEGWVVFFVLLIFCFPLCLLGLLVRTEDRACSACGMKLG